MGKQPFISHTVNGYSRYDVPESKAFTCTPGILYPVRIDFINARDRVKIAQGIDVRSNPLAVPTFNPYTVRLHRFWVPLQLYHPEMRTNSSEFDMNNLSLNFVRTYVNHKGAAGLNSGNAYPNSLMAWLRIAQLNPLVASGSTGDSIPSADLIGSTWANADTYLAYWDIVRNYYSFSQYPLYSFAWPAAWGIRYQTTINPTTYGYGYVDSIRSAYFFQRYGDLSYLDYFFESQFYPGSYTSGNNTYNRMGLFTQIINSDTDVPTGVMSPATSTVIKTLPTTPIYAGIRDNQHPVDQVSYSIPPDPNGGISLIDAFNICHPMAVVPASPDRFSRMLPPTSSSDAVSIGSVFTVPQLAIASRLQEYKDLLGAGGSRFSDWLETFFASRIEHVDRPKLLFSASQTVNAQIIFATANAGVATTLGTQGGSIAFNAKLGRSQSYFFREPGYMIDMLSIRPVYYWQNIKPDYLTYQGADYFNPIYNDIGYQDVPLTRFSNLNAASSPATVPLSIYREPCFNEFRASYDEALGQFGSLSTSDGDLQRWIQSRSIIVIPKNTITHAFSEIPTLFTDISTVNTPFAADTQDNFFVNLSYSVQKKNLVNKSFATRLANR